MTDQYPGSGSSAPLPSSPNPVYGAQSTSGAPTAPARQDAGFFRAILDFRFEHFITVKFSGFIYALAFIVVALFWLLQIILAIVTGLAIGSDPWTGEQSFNAIPLVFAILFGWIPSVILLVALRLGLEFAVATIRTAQNTTRIAEGAEARF